MHTPRIVQNAKTGESRPTPFLVASGNLKVASLGALHPIVLICCGGVLPLFEERGTARQRGGEFLTRKPERLFTAR